MVSWWRGTTIKNLATHTEDRICIVKYCHKGNELIGYAMVDKKVGLFAYEGEVIKRNEFEVLLHPTEDRFSWKDYRKDDPLPPNAFHAGDIKETPVYVGKSLINGLELYGGVCDGILSVATDNWVITPDSFQILVVNKIPGEKEMSP
ncbi:Hypothetical predicted protein [Cloeon dipterum]|uniref:Uncharacterized protein n=1 Tax=Cloeon dipterum TaxID=197152 RepID=A0A8S1DK02_9INSE|nr:Hypothetical predicted protein [Cloeon dipterum]